MKKQTFLLGDRKVTGFFLRVGSQLWVHACGHTFVYEPHGDDTSGEKETAVSPQLEAPMPGKVTAVQVTTGDQVVAGQVLIIMEAMKMEYSLKAPAKSRVEAVNCQVGDQVRLKQVLVELAIEESE